MFRLSSLTKRTTAVFLMVVFLHMLVGQCLCAALGVPMAPGKAVAAAPTASASTHACCAKFGQLKRRLGANKPAPAKRSHDCCKDKASAALKALDVPAAKQLVSPALLSSLPACDFPAARFGTWDLTAAVVLWPREHLPPKIPDIRVFVRSLTV